MEGGQGVILFRHLANQVNMPLNAKIGFTYPGGWSVGWSEFDYIAISAQLN